MTCLRFSRIWCLSLSLSGLSTTKKRRDVVLEVGVSSLPPWLKATGCFFRAELMALGGSWVFEVGILTLSLLCGGEASDSGDVLFIGESTRTNAVVCLLVEPYIGSDIVAY